MTLPALNTNASPNGWIDDGVNETRGNNVDAHTDHTDDDQPDLPRPQGSPFRVFDFAMDLNQPAATYANAAVVQLFYWNNFMHDRLYELGFTEAAGNFQNNNFGRGGAGNDAVQADAQDGGGVNNANFSTPPDGSAGRMQMYIFNGPSPNRDGDFDAEVVLHEYTHGLSNRRVGGGVGISALQTGGMGEGWSDFYGLSLLSEAGDNLGGNYAAGAYVTYQLGGLTQNYYYGIRRYPYSTDLTKNPLTFKDIDPAQASSHAGIPRSPIIGSTANEVHNMGEVWCVTLWEARANLVNKYGWVIGNQLILKLVTDGMNLSPANPNFLQARDAIIQADVVDNGGANLAELWTAFAKRGMGKSATSPNSGTTSGLKEAYDVPDALLVTPAILPISGPVGGPFTPNPAVYTLTNTGSSPLNWTLASTSVWISVTPTSGTLSPGGGATNVSVSVNPVVTNFPAGLYRPVVWFTNQTSGFAQPAVVAISAVGFNMFDDFDPGIDLTQWSEFGGTVGITVAATNTGGFVSPPNSLWFGGDNNRYAITIPINTTLGGGISFDLHLANGGGAPWETVDLPAEGIALESSTNGGGTWTILDQYTTPTYYSWTHVSLAIPAAAKSSSTLFRWRQLSHSGNDFDHWALDNVTVIAGPTPPIITGQPQSQTWPVGDDAVLNVNAYGSDPLTFQWSCNGTNLSGATNAFLVLTNVQLAQAGTYAVALTNTYGWAISSNAQLAVYLPVCAPPSAGLVSWWLAENNANDFVGPNPGTLLVGAGYAKGRVGQAFDFHGGNLVVPDSPSLRLTNQLTIEAWVYARTLINDQPLINKIGGTNGNHGYQLLLNGNALRGQFNSPGESWPGPTIVSSIPFTPGVWHHVAWTYDQVAMKLYQDGVPVATNAVGPRVIATSLSNLRFGDNDTLLTPFDGLIDEAAIYNRALSAGEIAAIYNAANVGKCSAPQPPSIVLQPQGVAAAVAASASFTVGAAGTQPLRYQWRFNTTNLPAATNASLTLSNLQFSQAGNYDVVVTNLYGATNSDPALLTVLDPPSITQQPGDLVVTVGSNATFTVTATGGSPLFYQWYFNGAALAAATNPSLSLTSVIPNQTGFYRVVVSNQVGSVTSRDAALLVQGNGVCTSPPSGLVGWWTGNGHSGDAVNGNHGTISGGVTFPLGEVFQAFDFNPANGSVIVPDSASLRLTNFATLEAWIFPRSLVGDQCILSKDGGAGGLNGYQLLLSGSSLQAQFNSPGQGWPGNSITRPLTITTGVWHHVAWTYDQSAMKLYWDGQPVATNVIGATAIQTSSSRFRISGDDAGHGYLDGMIDEPAVYNRALTAAEILAIYTAGSGGKCSLAPGILSQPSGQSLVIGSTVAFSAAASGTLPLTYQWYFTNSPIAGATTTSLTLTNISFGSAGNYQLRVTNIAGLTFSSNALLTVLPPPPCTAAPTGMISWWRAEGNGIDAANLNNGSLTGVSFTNGIVGQAFSFNPANGSVAIPDSASLRLSNQITIEAWINSRSLSGDQCLITKFGGPGGNNGFQILLSGSTLQAQFNSPGENWPGPRVQCALAITNGVWYHLAWTYDQSAMKLYWNGVPVATNIIGPRVIATASSRFCISGDDNVNAFFNGSIDEPAIYNRALSAAEIAGIYSAGGSGKCGLAPAIVIGPQNQTAQCSSNVSFTVTTTGTAPLAYRWYSGSTPVPGGTNLVLTFTNVTFPQAGSYFVVVTNVFGSVTSTPAVLTVIDTLPPTITACAPPHIFPLGSECSAVMPNLTSEVVASDPSGPVTVTQNPIAGTPLSVGSGIVTFTVLDFSGNSNTCASSYTVKDVTPPTVLTNLTELVLGYDTNCIALLPDLTGTNCISARDNCGGVIVTQSPIAGTSLPFGTNLVFLTVTDSATNQTVVPVNVIVQGPPNITASPTNQSVVLSSNAVFTVSACGLGPLHYQWLHAGTNLPGATLAGLNLVNVKTNDAGTYQVVITNSVGASTSAVATLTVLRPPVIIGLTPNRIAAPGATVTFNVLAQGLAPLSYQWLLSNVAISGRTNAALTLTNIQGTDFGSYRVSITNADGSALSQPTLLIQAASPLLSSPSFNLATFSLMVPTEVGPTYVVEYSDSIVDPSWHVLTTIAGTGSPVPITDNGQTNTTRFYRVRLQ